MPVVRSRLALVALASLVAAALVACSLDWSARGVERDAGPEASVPDAPSGDTGGSDAGDAGPEGGVDCAMLEAELADARKAARSCTLGSQTDCRTTGVVDECGCTIPVTNDAGTPNTDHFAMLASQVRASCSPVCDGGCSPIQMGAWGCAGGTSACYP